MKVRHRIELGVITALMVIVGMLAAPPISFKTHRHAAHPQAVNQVSSVTVSYPVGTNSLLLHYSPAH